MTSIFRVLFIWITAIGPITGCMVPGTPSFYRKAPLALRLSPSPLSPRRVVLIHHPIGPFTFVSSGPTFRLAVKAASGHPPENYEPLGDIRSTDERLSPPTYDRLRCGWCAPIWGQPNHACRGRQKARDREGTAPILHSALADLRRQAAASGVQIVADVKCFASQHNLQGKMWCEGLAMRRPR